MSATVDDAAELLRVLGHPLRLAIMQALARQEQSVSELARATGLAMSTLSQQLAILRKAELVRTRREAKQVFYEPDPATLAQAQAAVGNICTAAPDRPGVLPAVPVGAAMLARMNPRED
ncbi:MAG: winged helix-turn-helix transcriptional regulator [Sphingomonadales bacterium]|nr:winged helix-turn-helix transcriptional regulator [Sphingomonadales bacterium]